MKKCLEKCIGKHVAFHPGTGRYMTGKVIRKIDEEVVRIAIDQLSGPKKYRYFDFHQSWIQSVRAITKERRIEISTRQREANLAAEKRYQESLKHETQIQ